MKLTILNVAYPLATVGPHAVGGAEQVVSLLDRMLTADGHRSIVVACEGSECAGALVPIPRLRGTLDHHLQPGAAFPPMRCFGSTLRCIGNSSRRRATPRKWNRRPHMLPDSLWTARPIRRGARTFSTPCGNCWFARPIGGLNRLVTRNQENTP